MARSSPLGWFVNYVALAPFVGETVMRLRNFLIMRLVLNGGVADPNSISPALMKEMYRVGNGPGHYRAFLSLLRNSASWETAAKDYARIEVTVLLVWGAEDWARPAEREHDRKLIPGVETITIEGGGHFLALDPAARLGPGHRQVRGTRPRVLNDPPVYCSSDSVSGVAGGCGLEMI